MSDIIDIVKRKKIEGLVCSVIIAIFCFINIILNMDVYKKVIFNEYSTINSIEDLNKAYMNKERFLLINLKDANLEYYQLKSNNITANIYTLKLDDKNVLVTLKENTLITDKTEVEIAMDDQIIEDLKTKFDTKNYYNISLSNINYHRDKKVFLYKIYILFGLLFISLLSSIINTIFMLIPTKTLTYRKYIKKYYQM